MPNDGYYTIAKSLRALGVRVVYGVIGIPVTQLASTLQVCGGRERRGGGGGRVRCSAGLGPEVGFDGEAGGSREKEDRRHSICTRDSKMGLPAVAIS